MSRVTYVFAECFKRNSSDVSCKGSFGHALELCNGVSGTCDDVLAVANHGLRYESIKNYEIVFCSYAFTFERRFCLVTLKACFISRA